MALRTDAKFITALRRGTQKSVEHLSSADIVVGIPAYYNAETIAFVIETASKGLELYFSEYKAVIFVADGGSTDDTREAAREIGIESFNVEKIVAIYRGVPGKGSAVRAIFEAAHFLGARAVALFDADLRSITPEWIKNVIEPILNGYAYVTPLYNRYKYDATITNTIAYDLTRTLYGVCIRQPIGGDFGIGGALVKSYLEEDVWESDIAKFGIDIWLTTTAIVKKAKICEARLGVKIHDEKEPSHDLSPMFREVVGTIFSLMDAHESFWMRVKSSKPVDIVGEFIGEQPEPFVVDQGAMIEYFKLGFNNFGTIWKKLLDKKLYASIEALAQSEEVRDFVIPIEKWVMIVYDYTCAFHATPHQEFKLLDTMIPLYYARVASMVNELEEKDTQESETYFEAQAEAFEKLKPYLEKCWIKGDAARGQG
jgi:glycosyltransferase involved in cell wall biosynthesis